MASIANFLPSTVLVFLLLAIPTFSAEFSQFSPSPSPSPSPQLISPSPSPSPYPALSHSPSPSSGASYDDYKNYPIPSPMEDNGASFDNQNSPSPAPDIGHDDRTTAGDLKTNDESSDGGKTAGITIGVIAAACIVGVGSVVYKKRQRNIRRSQYSHVTTIP